VNSEELELSLRTEFENYLKGVLAGMQQDVAEFQKNFEAEFEKHRSQMDDAFRNLSARFESDVRFDQAFTESVVEHLRLARDDGAQLTAQAFADAENLERATPSSANYDRLRDAINDISSQLTQAAILKSLVDNAANFTPRGAFFIVKHDNFVCWRRFDRDGHSADEAVRTIHFPLASDTILADAVNSLRTKDSSDGPHQDDNVFLDALYFGRPDRMFAVPLMARGRGVAVLYADRGNDDGEANIEAIESLVRVAGLTVELRAAAASASHPVAAPEATPSYVPMPTEEPVPHAEPETPAFETPEETHEESPAEEFETEVPATEVSLPEDTPSSVESTELVEEYTGAVAVDEPETLQVEPQHDEVESAAREEAGYFDTPDIEEEVAEHAPEYADVEVSEAAPAEPVNDFAFASSDSYDAPAETEAKEEPAEEYAYAGETRNGTNGHALEPAAQPVIEVAAAQPMKSRLSDRHVDLPIEVSEDERRFHNDARRFARLLVSEIKLYNEQRVNEGRDAGDLYDRLREAIDRSREMYEKRVQPQVAAKFDYFHYELVTNLAEGNDAKLGASYPGSTV
jgi:hypothetical protein